MDLIIKRKQLLPILLLIAVFLLIFILFFIELDMWERVCLPFMITFSIFGLISGTLSYYCKDKFIVKIYFISGLVHYIFILFWEILKYHLMNLPMPTDNIFVPFIVDNDGVHYHALGVFLNNNFNTAQFQEHLYGGLFPKFVGCIYHFFGNNPFIVSCINTTIAAFSAIFFYLIGKHVLINNRLAKIYALMCVLNFSHIINTSTLMRDNYIVFFIYLSIICSFYFYKSKNIIFIILTCISLYCLYLFRPYATFVVLGAIIATWIFLNLRLKITKNNVKTNKIGLAIILLSPFIFFGIIFLFVKMTTFMNILSVEDMINLRDTAYVGSNTDYSMDFGKLYKIFFLLPFMIGYFCLFFAPFPWEWILVRRLIYVADMIVLYAILPSFFKNLRKVIQEKKYFTTIFLFSLFFMFSIYCITVGNSGSIHRLRGPLVPMIYLIAMYRPDKFLSRILNKIQKWRLV